MMRMVDTGQQRTSRKTGRKIPGADNKHKQNPEAEKIKETKPAQKIEMKERILRFEQEEAGKNKQEPTRNNKPEDASEAAQNKMKKRQKKPPQVQAKMTSLSTEVKNSARKNNFMLKCVSPSLNTRMKTPKKVTKGTLLKLARPDASFPVRISKFRALLKSWQNSSNLNLTSAVANL